MLLNLPNRGTLAGACQEAADWFGITALETHSSPAFPKPRPPVPLSPRNFFKVERWTNGGLHVERRLFAGNSLDEATAALNSKSERHVQEAIAELCKGRTTIVIAHRLSTIMHADCILVVSRGGLIVESGRHDELLRKGGRYASFYRLQLKEQAAAREPVAV